MASALFDHAAFWLGYTVLAYALADCLFRYSGGHPVLLPIFTGVLAVAGALLLTGTPYPRYADHVSFLLFLIGPATVALAVPLHVQWPRLKRLALPVLIALLAGALTAILSAIGIAAWFGGSPALQMTVAPKSATMPIAMAVSAVSGGIPSLTTIAVALTGISAAMMSVGLFSWFRLRDEAAQGFALGVTAHAIGVARAFRTSETAGAFAALGMALNGVATALLIPILHRSMS